MRRASPASPIPRKSRLFHVDHRASPAHRLIGRSRARWLRARSVVVAVAVVLVAACATTPLPKSVTVAFDAPQSTRLGKDYADAQRAHPDNSGLYLLETGIDALAARTALIERAERSIDLQYFIVREDATSQFLFHKLREAADRGVRVRLLLDDIHKPRDEVLANLGAHPSMELRVFNRFRSRGWFSALWPFEFLTDVDRLNRRMHNKVFVVDNQVAIVGGRNLGDEYFEAAPEMDFRDLDLLAVGPVVRKVSRSFDDYWNSEWTEALPGKSGDAAVTAERERLAGTPFAARVAQTAVARAIRAGQLPLVWAPTRFVKDAPDKIEKRPSASDEAIDLPPAFIDLAKASREELLIISAYFVPGRAGTAFLAELEKGGVNVSVLTNSLAATDVAAVHGGYARYRPDLVAAGVDLYELKPTAAPPRRKGGSGLTSGSSQASLHAKAVVFDRRRVYIGSLNIDPRSVWLNTEAGFLVDSPAVSEQVVRWYLRATRPTSSFRVSCVRLADACKTPIDLVWTTTEKGETVEFRSDPMASFSRRFSADLWYFLPLDQHL